MISRTAKLDLGHQIILLVLLGGLVLAPIGPVHAESSLALDFEGTTQLTFFDALTLGWAFTVEQPIAVDGLGFFDDFVVGGQGLQNDHRVRIWADDGSEELLAESTITNASTPIPSTAVDGRWLFNDIETVVLPPGDYVIGADDPECNGSLGECDAFRLSTTATTLLPGLDYVVAREAAPPGFPFSMVAARDDGYFGPNFRATVIPEPATFILCLVVAALGYASRPRQKRF